MKTAEMCSLGWGIPGQVAAAFSPPDVVITALKELAKQRSPYKAAQSLRATGIVFPLFPEELKYMETRSVLRQHCA
jgi:hypothetical protein